MTRLIFKYYYGGEVCSGETVEPFLYESKEQALFDLELKIEEFISKREIIQVEIEQIRIKKDRAALRNKNVEYFGLSIKEGELSIKLDSCCDIVFGGMEINLWDHVYQSEAGGKLSVDMPRIFTIDEFFSDVEAELQESTN